MGKISEGSLEGIDNADLVAIMRHHGHEPFDNRDKHNIVYCCPFHSEKTGSFKISTTKLGGKHNAPLWKCFGSCSDTKGYGAISLEARLSGLQLTGYDYIQAAKNVASICNIDIEEIEPEDLNGKKEYVAPQDEYSFEFRDEFTIYELEALGCKCDAIMRKVYGKDGAEHNEPLLGKDGKPVYKYSFSLSNNQKDDNNPESIIESNFDPKEITKRFNLFPVKSYTGPKFKTEDGTYKSRKVSATDSFPILVYMYDNKTWGRIYQPYYRKVKDKNGKIGADYRFTFWYKGNSKRPDLNKFFYGDTLAMAMLADDKLTATEALKKLDMKENIPVKTEKDKESGTDITTPSGKVYDLILCSGGSDAINTYFHTGAHVCWINSENGDISPEMYKKMDRVALNNYIMYDLDDTGKRRALKTALRYLDLRLIFLPERLRDLKSPRSQKPCKDAKDYFMYYNPKTMEGFEEGIRTHFRQIMKSSLSLRFWSIKVKKDKEGNEKSRDYCVNSARIFNFLASQGLFRFVEKNSTDKIGSFVYVRDNIVSYISKDSIASVALSIVRDFIRKVPDYCEDLEQAVINSTRISPAMMNNLPTIDLDFVSWGKDFDYLFFKNTAVKITKNEISTVNYNQFPFNVNAQAIKDAEFTLEKNRFFTIDINPDYKKLEEELFQMERDKNAPKEEIVAKRIEKEESGRLWKWKLTWNETDQKRIPQYIRFLYNTCRVYWRKEKEGRELTATEKQEQDLYFINKVAAIGYSLCRYRNPARTYAVFYTEASVAEEGKSSGGTGKSLIIKSLDFARNSFTIDGKSFKPDKGALNFQRFIRGVHSHIHLEDVCKDFDFESLFVMISSGFTSRALYASETFTPIEEVPLMQVTSNYMINLSSDSSQRRLFMVGMSDYYHARNDLMGTEGHLPEDDGFDDLTHPAPDQLNHIENFMAQCMQFYMTVGNRIMPPMAALANRTLVSTVGEKFVEFFNEFFSKEYNYNCPIDRETLFHDYLDYKELSAFGKEKSVLAKFKTDLQFYCRSCGIIMNPDVILQNSEKLRKEVRTKAWVKITLCRNTINETSGRVLISSKGALYFYKKGSVPTSIEGRGKAPEYDPEPILDDEGKVITWDPEQIKKLMQQDEMHRKNTQEIPVTKTENKDDLPF